MTPSRSSSGRHSAFSPDVRESPHRQSRRDRASHQPGVQGDGHRHRGGALHRRCRCDACAARRRERVHRPAGPRHRAISTSPRSSRPARSPAPRRSIGLRVPLGDARFAEIVREHGITFIGPTPEHIRMMGDKITAIKAVKELGIPTVPGSGGAVEDADALRIAREIGFPVLIKATAGGGGARHEGGEQRDGAVAGAVDRAGRGQIGVRQRPGLYGEISPEAAPYRDPGSGRRGRQRRPSG